MNQELMDMAKEAHLLSETEEDYFVKVMRIEAFAALVAAAEREACAKVCVAVAERNIWWDINEIEAAVECAAAIRERGETE